MIKKRLLFVNLIFLFAIVNGTAQINNLSDLIKVSDLSVYEMIEKLQYTWDIKTPSQEFLDNNRLGKESMSFDYKGEREKGDRNQVLKRITIGNFSNGEQFYLTELISNEKDVFNRIKNNLKNLGFELQSQGEIMSMYSDGNLLLKIQTESYGETKLPNGFYSVQILIGSRTKTYETYIKYLSNDKGKNNSGLFTGKKKFCEELKAWYYLVTIEKDNIAFELYPGAENDYYKNKTKPVEVVKGKIIGNIIRIPRPENCKDCGDEYETGRFKYKNGVLYEANNEGEYNEYFECAENTKSSVDNVLSNLLDSNSTSNEKSTFKSRKIIERPSPEYKCNEQGKVIVEIVVNKKGEVVKAKAGIKGTTNHSKCLFEAAENAALNTKFNIDEDATDNQIGSIEYNFRFSQ